MDRRENVEGGSKYKEDLEHERQMGNVEEAWLIDENGNRYRMPYKIIKQVIFNGLSQKEMIDPQYAARLQYRLSLHEPIIKASVNYIKGRITIIYNPKGAANRREQMSLQELIDALAKEGVHADMKQIEERDYDYVKEFYSYAYFPPTIREHPPYGYTDEEWAKMKDEWKERTEKQRAEKLQKFHQWQGEYMESITKTGDPNPERKKGPKEKKGGEKEFWFHGV